ncbi:MAG: hypothetical protein STSR0007_03840 [Thermovirga sp.]
MPHDTKASNPGLIRRMRVKEQANFIQYTPCWNSSKPIFAVSFTGTHVFPSLATVPGIPGSFMDDITLGWIDACRFMRKQGPA